MQFRYLGGSVGLGIVTAVFNNNMKHRLASILAPDDVSRLLQSTQIIHSLPASSQLEVQKLFGESFSLQWKTLLGFIGAQIPTALMML